MSTEPEGSARIAGAVGLRSMATDFWVSRALHVAVKLGLPDLLANGPQSIDTLATQSGANADTLFRLIRVLATHNVFIEHTEGQFGLTSWGEMLRADKPGSMRDYILLSGEPAAGRLKRRPLWALTTSPSFAGLPTSVAAKAAYFRQF